MPHGVDIFMFKRFLLSFRLWTYLWSTKEFSLIFCHFWFLLFLISYGFWVEVHKNYFFDVYFFEICWYLWIKALNEHVYFLEGDWGRKRPNSKKMYKTLTRKNDKKNNIKLIDSDDDGEEWYLKRVGRSCTRLRNPRQLNWLRSALEYGPPHSCRWN